MKQEDMKWEPVDPAGSGEWWYVDLEDMQWDRTLADVATLGEYLTWDDFPKVEP